MKPEQTPLYDALVHHAKQRARSFHVPGHKNGTVFSEKAQKYFHSLLLLDLTELSGLDDLHHPQGPIAEAQVLLAEFYGSDRSYFLVGGSTVGNLAMLLSVCGQGDTVLIQRNCHQSVINALDLAGAQPVFVAPMIDEESALATAPSLDTVRKALESYPQAKALLLTHPNYYGMAANLGPLIEEAHSYEVPVLVDEAHGAHFVLEAPFPQSSLACGADAVVQSAHKTLPAMTMGAFLHTNGPCLSRQRLEKNLQRLQSSSPSYPIMASLDLARNFLENLPKEELHIIGRDIKKVRHRLQQFPQLSVLAGPSTAYAALDPLKITVQTRGSLSGFELQQRLQKQGVYPELADPYHVLLVMPLARFEETDALMAAIEKALDGVHAGEAPPCPHPLEMPPLSQPVRLDEELSTLRVPLEETAGLVCAQEVTPYPPGVPLLLEGETISASQITALYDWAKAGGGFQTGGDFFEKGLLVASETLDYGTIK